MVPVLVRHSVQAQPPQGDWELGPSGTKASLRALCAVDNNVLWTAGSQACVLRSEDGGASWTDCSPRGYSDLEFRSLHAWDAKQACIASAGTPAVILRTADGGLNWSEVYRHASPAAFFDGLRFWDLRRGLAFSDPVDERLLVVETGDGGKHWLPVAAGQLVPGLAGEAGFAASNSALCLGEQGSAWIGTGGADGDTSRIHFRSGWKERWQVSNCPLPSSATAGVFSIAQGKGRLIAVGGDYRPEVASQATAAWSGDGGVTWQLSARPPAAFRSAIACLPDGSGFLCVGPSGSDFSMDGDQWQAISTQGFHALAIAPDAAYAVGADGRFGKLPL